MKFRAFIAVEFGEIPGLRQFHADLSNLGSGVRPVDLGHLHVTLKFLGDTDESLVPKLGEIMRASIDGIGPMTIRLTGSGTLPPKPPARVVWVGLQGAEALALIASRLETSCRDIGFEPEGRPFRPHLTLARVKDPRMSNQAISLAEKYAKNDFGSMVVKEILLKKSVLSPKGPTYTTVLNSPMAFP